jgi:alkylation response protein AidB-like acyl-CoA dehydrogenase
LNLKLKEIASTGVTGLSVKDHGGPGLSVMESCAVTYEIAKVDGSIASFFAVHNCIGIAPIDMLGS